MNISEYRERHLTLKNTTKQTEPSYCFETNWTSLNPLKQIKHIYTFKHTKYTK